MKEIKSILEQYPREARFSVAIMHDVQNNYGYVAQQHIKAIAKYLNVSTAEIFANATFYDAFHTEAKGMILFQVCDGTVCHTKGSEHIIQEIENALGIKAGETTNDGKFSLKTVRCMGACNEAPIASGQNEWYGGLKKGDGEALVAGYKENDWPKGLKKISDIPILESGFERKLLIQAETLEEYIAQGGFKGLRKALGFSKKKCVIQEVKKSGLRGRSGSGFPVGVKWESAYNIPGQDRRTGIVKDKYIVANGDEGDPGAFMDRWILEKNPYAVIEGMIIAGYAINAQKGYLYIRNEYQKAIDCVRRAIEDCEQAGLLGKNVLGNEFSFECEIICAAGSYVCGEEGALMESLEGRTGVPRIKPPLPTVKGIMEQPTIINNVETLANIPLILKDGGEEYAKIGIESCSGTKLISLAGAVKNKGLTEIPMGKITLRQLIYDIGGGIENDHGFKCIQTGGPSGGYITEENLDLTLDFDSLKQSGSLLGSGGIVVIDDNTCAVDMAKYMIEFLADESCGTCTPCREGLRCILEILTKITNGKGSKEDLDLIKEIAFVASKASRCALGMTIGNPILTTLKYFKDEYEEHIEKHRCPANVCAMIKEE